MTNKHHETKSLVVPTSLSAGVVYPPKHLTPLERAHQEVHLFRRALVWVLQHHRRRDPRSLLGYRWVDEDGMPVTTPLDLELLIFAIQRQIDLGSEHAG